MNALLLKDWYVLIRQSKLTMVIVIVFTIVGVASSTFFYAAVAAIVCVMLPLTTMAYDQMHHWDRFVIGLPIERKDVVRSKYLLALLALSLSVLMLAIVGFAFYLANDIALETVLFMLWTQLVAGLFFLSVNYPIVIKMGFERGRIWYIIITIPIVSLSGVLNSILDMESLSMHVSIRNFAYFIRPILLVIGSYLLSVRYMESKEY
ncbi:MAG TPA: hypothetical protein DHV69_07750 [Sphaerochaeta sp.]|nr:hypothetical protein [Sphaerochaeta sp.]